MQTMIRRMAVAAAVCLAAGSANAAAIFDIELQGSPGVTTAGIQAGLTVDIFLTVGPEGSAGHEFDVETLAGVAESGSVVLSPGSDFELAPGVVLDGNAIREYDQAAILGSVAPGRYLVGTATFDFTGADVITIANAQVLDDAGNLTPTSANSFTVFNMPEPSTASLLLLGFGGLAFAGRCR